MGGGLGRPVGSSVSMMNDCVAPHTWIPRAQRMVEGTWPHSDSTVPPQDYELWKSSDKICRQLIYHLTPHTKRQLGSSLPQKKTQSW